VDEKKKAIEFHIRETVGRTKGLTYKWDVVNEAFADDTNQYRSFWSELGGIDMVRKCFVWARDADPKAILVYNDYDCTNMTRKADAIYDMVKELKRTGTPIDEVGFQAHESIHVMDDAWFESMRKNIQRFKALGVRVSISELDLRIDLYQGSLAQKLERQSTCFYKMIVTALSDLSACNEVTIWQFSSKYTWIYEFFKVDNTNVPCPWDNNNVATVSVDAIKRALRAVVAPKSNEVVAPTSETKDWSPQECTLTTQMYRVHDRKFSYSGPIIQVKPGKARVRFALQSQEPVTVTLKWTIAGSPTNYKNLITTSDENIDLTFDVPDATSAFLYIETKSANTDFMVGAPILTYM
jgi:hypothetical protein